MSEFNNWKALHPLHKQRVINNLDTVFSTFTDQEADFASKVIKESHREYRRKKSQLQYANSGTPVQMAIAVVVASALVTIIWKSSEKFSATDNSYLETASEILKNDPAQATKDSFEVWFDIGYGPAKFIIPDYELCAHILVQGRQEPVPTDLGNLCIAKKPSLSPRSFNPMPFG